MQESTRRAFYTGLVVIASGAAGALAVQGWSIWRARKLPTSGGVIEQVREIARLETLQVSAYKKISFQPAPSRQETMWQEVWEWIRHSVNKPRGKAIVFADIHLGMDLQALAEDDVQVRGQVAYIALPSVQVRVAIKPGETEVIGSNLNSSETAQLLERARVAFARQAEQDEALQHRAESAAQRAIELLLRRLGFVEVRFNEQPPSKPTDLSRVLKESLRTSCSRTRASEEPLRSGFFGIPTAAGMAKKGVYQCPLSVGPPPSGLAAPHWMVLS